MESFSRKTSEVVVAVPYIVGGYDLYSFESEVKGGGIVNSGWRDGLSLSEWVKAHKHIFCGEGQYYAKRIDVESDEDYDIRVNKRLREVAMWIEHTETRVMLLKEEYERLQERLRSGRLLEEDGRPSEEDGR